MEENAEQEKAEEETDFEHSEMEEDDIDLLKPSKNEDMDAFVENDDGTDDLDEDEIIAEEMLNEADDTASNQMSQMKEQEFVEKSENTRNPSLQSAKKGHNRNTALKRHMRIFHPETLAETVRP